LLLMLLFFLGSMISNSTQGQKPDSLTTSQFTEAVENYKVTEANYNAVNGSLTGYYKPGVNEGNNDLLPFITTYVGEDSLNTLMASHPEINYNVSVQDPNFWMTLLGYGLPLLGIGVLIWIVFTQFNQANNRQMNFGKNKTKKAIEERPKTKFSDVAGIDEAVEELQEIKEFLSNPKRFSELGAKIPRGVLLVGAPGTGKTLLARAVAGEAGVPFFSISGSDFVEMFVGVGASRVRDLFEKAKEAAPSIIFIDEIDAVGRQRGAGLGGGHDEREQTLNQLLVEMDGFEENASVILIAATNRVDILDPALLRPGRFDRQIVVDRPDLKGREQILKVHSAGKPLAHSVDLEAVAKLTPGFTGADLANMMNEAAILTARKNKKLITMTELNEAMEREIAGPERKGRIITNAEKRTIAYHESGHALVGHILENSDPVHKISIISRGQALGYTLSLPGEDRFLNTREEMYDDLAVFLGGRVAEEIFCHDITTGASNDLERATKMARQMVTRYGMTEELGSQVYGEANHEVFLGRDYGATPDYSDETARRIDEEVAKIMRKAHDRAHDVLNSRKEQMELMVQVLLERETVDGEALAALLENRWDDYLEHEDEILARRAEELRKQEEDDEKRRAEEQKQAMAAGAPAQPGLPGATPAADGRFTLEDVFAGRVRLDDLLGKAGQSGPGGQNDQSGQSGQGGQSDQSGQPDQTREDIQAVHPAYPTPSAQDIPVVVPEPEPDTPASTPVASDEQSLPEPVGVPVVVPEPEPDTPTEQPVSVPEPSTPDASPKKATGSKSTTTQSRSTTSKSTTSKTAKPRTTATKPRSTTTKSRATTTKPRATTTKPRSTKPKDQKDNESTDD
jgi:cell division protease FtsH